VEDDRARWTAYQLGEFIADHGDDSTRAAVVKEFNTGENRLRQLMGWVLPRMAVTTDELSEEALEWFVAGLEDPVLMLLGEPVLASLATEEFLETRILPLCDPGRAGPKVAQNAHKVLTSGGKRFGRRLLPA
jgi:hypothetical protein